jgi:hypothetical protein
MDDDHIRFSWLVTVAVFLGFAHCISVEKNKVIRVCCWRLFSVVLLIAYLHILAAKTGLVCLYAGCLLYFLIHHHHSKKMEDVAFKLQ